MRSGGWAERLLRNSGKSMAPIVVTGPDGKQFEVVVLLECAA
jgi:hypothetical protein